MKSITKSQIAAIHALLGKHGLSDDKKQIIEQISGGRVSSTAGLCFDEAMQWINAMNGPSRPSRREGHQHTDPDKRQRMINAIIAMAHEMGTISRDTIADAHGRLILKNNYEKLNKWMVEKSYLKKPLNKYSYPELPKLVSQFKNVYFSWLKKSN